MISQDGVRKNLLAALIALTFTKKIGDYALTDEGLKGNFSSLYILH